MTSGKFFPSPPESSIVLDRPARYIDARAPFESPLFKGDPHVTFLGDAAEVPRIIGVSGSPTRGELGLGNDVIDVLGESQPAQLDAARAPAQEIVSFQNLLT